MTQEALKLALEALEENHHLIEEHERPEYLVHYDQIISLLAKSLAQEKTLQALHDENQRLGLYKDAYAQPDHIPDIGKMVVIGLLKRVHDELMDVLNSINNEKIHHDGDDFHELLRDVEQAIEAKLKQKNGYAEEKNT